MLIKLLSPTYQCMVLECESAIESWEVLKTFFAKKNRHNGVQVRKELHGFCDTDWYESYGSSTKV